MDLYRMPFLPKRLVPKRALLVAMATLVIPLVVTGQDSQNPQLAKDPTSSANETSKSGIPRIYRAAPEELSPRSLELRQRIEREQSELAELQQAFNGVQTDEARREILQAINALKEATELDLLRIQLKHAKLAGHTEIAAQLENALKLHLEAPAPKRPEDHDPTARRRSEVGHE